MDTNLPCPITTWSTSSISSSRLTSTSFDVVSMSSSLGVGSPDGMIMGHRDGRAVAFQRAGEHFGRPHNGGVDVTRVERFYANDLVLGVHEDDAKFFAREIGHFAREQPSDVVRRNDRWEFLGSGRRYSATQLNPGEKLASLGLGYAVLIAKVLQ